LKCFSTRWVLNILGPKDSYLVAADRIITVITAMDSYDSRKIQELLKIKVQSSLFTP
jgi:hypothetical protein